MLTDLLKITSPKYSERVSEVVKALDSSLTYSTKHVTNPASLKSLVIKASKDRDGFRLIESAIIPLSGTVSLVPQFKVAGDFAVVLISARLLNASTGVSTLENNIVVYEKQNDVSALLGGIFA